LAAAVADPVGHEAPPIPAREINVFGMMIAQELEAHGQPGAVHMLDTYDAWYPRYIDYMPVYQNIPSWWTETQGGNCSIRAPRRARRTSVWCATISVASFSITRNSIRGALPESVDRRRVELRNAVDYMVTAGFATLKYAAMNRMSCSTIVTSPAEMSLRIPRERAVRVFHSAATARRHGAGGIAAPLAFMGIRVDQLDRDVTFDGASYPKGTWVIPMDQEYASLVRELFDPQKYPTAADNTPYDAAGWTLPYQMNVNVVEAKTTLSTELRTAMKPVQGNLLIGTPQQTSRSRRTPSPQEFFRSPAP